MLGVKILVEGLRLGFELADESMAVEVTPLRTEDGCRLALLWQIGRFVTNGLRSGHPILEVDRKEQNEKRQRNTPAGPANAALSSP
jgi:hypothetical protein